MKGINSLEIDYKGCIPTCIPRCEKGIYYLKSLKVKNGGSKKVIKKFIPSKSFDKISLEDGLTVFDRNINQTIMFKSSPNGEIYPSDYLFSIAPHISEELISSQNFTEIRNLAQHLTGNLTSFFGFESRLTSTNARSDYLIAVSSQKGEREALLNLIKNGGLPDKYLDKQEWRNVGVFTEKWADPASILYNNILGLWLEFDTADKDVEIPVPSIFLQTVPLRMDDEKDADKVKWVTRNAIPTLTGQKVSEKLEAKFFDALKKLPDGASVFHVASMLSRNTEGMRIVVKRIKPEDVVSYLESLGWTDQNNGLKEYINEIKKYSNCIRLHINITDGIDPKIGLECFISPDQYHKGQGWNEFFDHLVEKGMCLPNMKNAVLDFPGVTQEDPSNEFNFETYQPSVKLPDNNFSKAIVRYISHIKINYKPGRPIEAKAYTGVRLFGQQ